MPVQQPIKAVDANAIAVKAAAGCKDDLSEKAAQLAREKYPDTPEWTIQDIWTARTRFLRKDKWALFDVNHDGRLDFEEYRTMMWANFLSVATAGECVIKRDEFFDIVLGKRGDPNNGWGAQWMVDSLLYDYNSYDRDKKGFITKDDMVIYDRAAFDRADAFHGGYLTPDQSF